MRCFAAIETDQAVRQRLADVQQKLKKAQADVKWVRPDQIHLTVKFLGEVPVDQLEAIRAALGELCAKTPPLLIAVGKIGTFPLRGAPRVLWAGCEESTGRLLGLMTEVEARCRSLGVEPEDRPPRTHLTLGRVRSTKNVGQLRDLVSAHESEEFGQFQPQGATLFESVLEPQGPSYTTIGRFPFSGKCQ